MAMLRDHNRASSSFTPPPEHRPTIHPNLVVPPIYVTDSEDVSFSAMTSSAATSGFLIHGLTMHALPPLAMLVHPPIYTVPPTTVPPVISAQAPVSTMDHFPFQAPQPQISFSYPAPPPLNIPPTEPGTPTQAAPTAPPINFFLETETEQEKRMKKMEETIRALQAGISRFDYSDNDWNIFPSKWLPHNIKIPDFKRYDGTKDPQHHLRHYQSKMLSYWDYEEFIIQTFQDSLTGSALDCFMTLKAGDIHTWTNLSQKFLDQYRFCVETPPSLLDLNMMQMGVYYSHLLAHTSSFSDLIEARKKLDVGFKLGRIERPSRKKHGEASKRQTAGTSRKSKDATVGAVNSGHQASQPISLISRPRQLLFSRNLHNSMLPLRFSKVEPRLRDLLSRLNGLLLHKLNRVALLNPVNTSSIHLYQLLLLTYSGSFLRGIRLEQRRLVPTLIQQCRIKICVISFAEDELPSEGQGDLRALHIVCKCNNHVVGRIMIDNGFALNVCHVSTLKQMNMDMSRSRIRASKTTVRAFDGSKRKVNGEIDLLIEVGPCSFSVTFQFLEIPNAFSLLLGRPWIHAADADPSSLHQKLKFFVEGKLITVNGKEDYAIYKETAVPYVSIGEDQNLPFHSFDTISVIRDYREVGPSRADCMIGKVMLKNDYVLGTGLRAHAQGILQPIEMEEYRNRRGLGFRPSCHEIVQARRGKHLHRLAAHYRRLFRGIPVPPLS
ncbi:hypothetical protein CRG98_021389 [Punica granatum]|uniref:G-patch domain-containing protein n=1 Tax=Punica granatum TaxID=22663 RepID=A0A2I0JPJ1_PUNGR|nr:hypothetical protein CRG98_021389 [Punica granatum]